MGFDSARITALNTYTLTLLLSRPLRKNQTFTLHCCRLDAMVAPLIGDE